MSSLAIDELKSHLNAFIQTLTSGATTSEIIAGFRKANAQSISNARLDLENIAMTKLVNYVGKRRPSKFAGEPDLFEGFGVPNTIVLRDADGRLVHTPIGKASIAEAKGWALGHKSAPRRTPQQIEVQRLVERVEPFAEDDNTSMEIAILASRARGEEGKG